MPRATITDLKLKDGSRFKVDLSSANTYYPFGMSELSGDDDLALLMPERNWSSDWYRYGFQGQEKDDEIKGEGNSVNYKFRMHDTRLGRFFTIDPLTPAYPWNSPYAFSENRVIDGFELEGAEWSQGIFPIGNGKTEIHRYVYVQVIDKTSHAVPLEYIQQFKEKFKEQFSEMMNGGDTKNINYVMKPEWITYTNKNAKFKLELIDKFNIIGEKNVGAETVKTGVNADSYDNIVTIAFLNDDGTLKPMQDILNSAIHDFTHPIGLIHNISDEGEKITPEQLNTRAETVFDNKENGTKNVMYQTKKQEFDSKINSKQQENATKIIKDSRNKNEGKKTK